jgi:hypothetical protein
MLSGVPASASRMPDPYTSVQTFVTSYYTSGQMIPTYPASGTTSYGGTCYLFSGSGVKSLRAPTLTGGASDVTIAYNGGTDTDCGVNNVNFMSRPMGCNFTIIPQLIGPVHNITISAFPTLPTQLSTLAASPTGWPGTLSAALTTTHALWGGRTWSVSPGEALTFCAAPMDNRGFDFEVSNTERLGDSGDARHSWGGWVIWIWGMTIGDKLNWKCAIGEECAYRTNNTTAYGYPKSRVAPNPMKAAATKSTFTSYLEKGIGAYKFATDQVLPVAEALWKGVSGLMGSHDTHPKKFAFDTGFAPMTVAHGVFSKFVLPLSLRGDRPEPPPLPVEERVVSRKFQEEKEDQLEIVTPTCARRASLTPSLAPLLSARKLK